MATSGDFCVATDKWLLVCLAFNLKRFHTLSPVY
jgi:hypothetical protein